MTTCTIYVYIHTICKTHIPLYLKCFAITRPPLCVPPRIDAGLISKIKSFSLPWLFTYITYSAAGAVRIYLIVDYLTSVFVMEDSLILP